MHHTGKNKKPTEDATSSAGHTDAPIIPGEGEIDKAFAATAAELALAGYALCVTSAAISMPCVGGKSSYCQTLVRSSASCCRSGTVND